MFPLSLDLFIFRFKCIKFLVFRQEQQKFNFLFVSSEKYLVCGENITVMSYIFHVMKVSEKCLWFSVVYRRETVIFSRKTKHMRKCLSINWIYMFTWYGRITCFKHYLLGNISFVIYFNIGLFYIDETREKAHFLTSFIPLPLSV